MRLVIENIYSEEGRRELIDAYTKSMWSANTYHSVTWCGVQTVQTPEDLIIIADLIWKTKPALIVECGAFRGGGLLFYASILNLMGNGEVIGIDLDTQSAGYVKSHPIGERITLMTGDSGGPAILDEIAPKMSKADSVMVILDSDHSAGHVSREIANFAPFIKSGGYLVVLDGVTRILHDVPGGDRHWKESNPEIAIEQFLKGHPEFERDWSCNRFGTSHAPGGYLKRK